MKLTKAQIDMFTYEGTSYSKGGYSRDIRWDDEVRGFGLRVLPTGRKCFVLYYRNEFGEQKLHKIGNYGELTLQEAKERARKLKVAVTDGADPQQERIEKRSSLTMKELTERYISDHALPYKRPVSVTNDRSMIKHDVLPSLGNKKVASIKRADIERLHRSMKHKIYRANRVLALLSKMFSLAVMWELRSDNPCLGVHRFTEDRRERYLKPDELKRLHQVLDGQSDQKPANVIRLLLLTGARRGEVLNATWDQFDLETDSPVWTKPSSRTKTKKVHRVPLPNKAKLLLLEIKASADGEYVFPGKGGNNPLVDIKKFWRSVCEAAKIEGVRIHDLRHSHASALASNGVSLPIIGRLLGHTQTSTTARYAHLYDDPLRAATELASGVLMPDPEPAPEAPSPAPSAEIIKLEMRRRS